MVQEFFGQLCANFKNADGVIVIDGNDWDFIPESHLNPQQTALLEAAKGVGYPYPNPNAKDSRKNQAILTFVGEQLPRPKITVKQGIRFVQEESIARHFLVVQEGGFGFIWEPLVPIAQPVIEPAPAQQVEEVFLPIVDGDPQPLVAIATPPAQVALEVTT